MLQLILLVAKVVFLVILYAFVLYVVRTINRALRHAALADSSVSAAGVVDRDARKALRRAAAAGELVDDEVLPRSWALVVKSAPHLAAGEQWPLVPGPGVLIGRAPDCDVQLRDTFVSAHHARLRVTPEGLTLQDLGSTNGTFVNGAQVSGPLLLQLGDELAVGDSVFTVEAY